MKENRKPYVSPTIESEKVDLPEALACVIYNAYGSSGYWEGSNVIDSPTANCW